MCSWDDVMMKGEEKRKRHLSPAASLRDLYLWLPAAELVVRCHKGKRDVRSPVESSASSNAECYCRRLAPSLELGASLMISTRLRADSILHASHSC